MDYKIIFETSELKRIEKWKKSNPILLKKLQKILNDIAQHPRTGLGHPEPLVGYEGVDVFSRRISASDRIVYEIYDDRIVVVVVQVGGHYADK